MLARARSVRAAVAATAAAVVVAVTPTVVTGSADAADGDFHPKLVTVDTPNRAAKARLQRLGLDLTEHAGQDYIEVVLHTPADLAALRDSNMSYDVRINDLLLREARNNRANAAFAAAVDESPLPSGRDSYRTLADYNNEMRSLAAARPSIAKRFALPHKSLDGKTIYGIEIGRGVRGPETGKPVFVLMGVHHAREWPSGELAMEFAYDLVKNYGKRARITRLVDASRVVVVPVVNVDGFDLSRTDGALIDLREADNGGTATILGTPGNTYRRKNCRVVDGQDTPDGTCRAASAHSPGGFGLGTDLNRNYGGFWGGPGAAGPVPDPVAVEAGIADPTYRGSAPFSEPETQNIRELVSTRQVTTVISNHTFSNLVLRPNGVHPDTIGPDGNPVGNAPDEAGMKALGAKMTAANGYRNIHGWELYDTTGTTEDWTYNATGGYGYTFEIGPNEFHPPFPQVIDEYLGAGEFAGKGNREAYLLALENAVSTSTHSVISGKAPKGATLRLRKEFATPTWNSSFVDKLNTTMQPSGNGSFTWHINQSTRPVVQDKLVEISEDQPVRSQSYQGGPTTVGDHVDHPFTITERDMDLLEVTLDWPTPDDLDLEVYKKNADGSMTEVASSGNFVGDKEKAELGAPEPGDYVLRVINFASTTPTYDLKATIFNSAVVSSEVVPGLIENWTLTCEKNGRALQKTPVIIERGEHAKVDLAECRRRY